MPSTLAAKLLSVLRGRLGLGLFALAGLIASLLVSHALRQAERATRVQDFERRQDLRHDQIRQSLSEYENSLFALRLVVENNYEFTPAEFERAAAEIHARTPGVQCIQWVPIVSAAELPAFVDRVRTVLHDSFTVHRLGPDGVPAPATPYSMLASGPDEFAVITYAYPLAGNENSLGYDIFTGPTAADLHAARRDFRITLTRPVRLVQGYDGVVLTTLVRREDSSDGPPFGGAGYVQMVLRLAPVVQRIWNSGPDGVADLALYDVTTAAAQPIYTHLAGRSTFEAVPVPQADFVNQATISRDFTIGGRTLRACYRPRADWLVARQGLAPFIVLGCGLALTALGCAYLRLLLRRAERIRAEVAIRTQELNESRSLLDTLIHHSPSAIWIKDTELRFQLVNAEFCRTYGLSPGEIIGHTDALLFNPEQVAELEKPDREVLRSGLTRYFEATYPIYGDLRTYLVGKFPLRHSDGIIHAVAGIATDITERRRAESQRNAMERRLLEAQKLESLGVLAGGIAHDFNNLLTGILGHASLSRALLPAQSPQQHSLLQIENAARRAAELCQQMLAYSGRGHFAVEPADVGTLVKETVPLLRLSISKKARLHFDLDSRLPSVVADLTQLRQIIMNLVVNASDALGEHEGDITLRTSLVAAGPAFFATCVHAPDLASGDYVCLEVTDTGCGMSAETQARIFDPFFTTKFTGRGLGLAAVLGIVRGHLGALRVTSAPGAGTTFRLYLPASATPPGHPVSHPSTPAVPANAAPEGRKHRLLLVDDEEGVRETAALLLRRLGYEVDVASDGAHALRLFLPAPQRPDAALLDLTMPGLSGGELLAELRVVRPDFPVLLMSGYSEFDAATLLAAPRTGFLAKPFTLAGLKEKLAKLLPPEATTDSGR